MNQTNDEERPTVDNIPDIEVPDYREFIKGFKEQGEIELNLNFNRPVYDSLQYNRQSLSLILTLSQVLKLDITFTIGNVIYIEELALVIRDVWFDNYKEELHVELWLPDFPDSITTA